MAYLSLARFAGDPDALLATYTRSEPTMSAVGRDHGLLMHAAARTDMGLLIVNLWPSAEHSGEQARTRAGSRRCATPRSRLSRSSTSTTSSTIAPCSPEDAANAPPRRPVAGRVPLTEAIAQSTTCSRRRPAWGVR